VLADAAPSRGDNNITPDLAHHTANPEVHPKRGDAQTYSLANGL